MDWLLLQALIMTTIYKVILTEKETLVFLQAIFSLSILKELDFPMEERLYSDEEQLYAISYGSDHPEESTV